jgi:tRNA/tmRNA/rRNA uracil-C5-methylase (TrmA/RlmC/RlmD family)
MNNIQVIKAINPFNYRTVVSYTFDKVPDNLNLWNPQILQFYYLINKTNAIDKSFIGMRININENNEFMIKLNVSRLDFDKIESFYFIASNFVNLKSFYYYYQNKIYYYKGDQSISIFINNIEVPISPNSFIQANHEMGNILYLKIKEIIKPNKNLICYGRNSFHIATQLNNLFENITCINPCEIAYNDGLKLIKLYNYNWNHICSKEALITEIEESSDDTTILISPGRIGYCLFNKININKFKNKQILYISCNEESLKKDLKNNFIIKNNIMIELFPGTQYNEFIIELEKI